MTEIEPTDSSTGRRRFFVRAVVALQATIGAAVAFVFGATTLSPSFLRRQDTWLRAADLESLRENQPVPVTLRITRHDGYSQVVDRTIVYLVRTGGQDVRPLQSTCTHLGCGTSYERKTKRILCRCHGGVFDVQGNVLSNDGKGHRSVRHVDYLDEDVSGGVRSHLDVDGASPGRGRRPRSRSVAERRGPRLDRGVGERCGPSPSDYVVARQHIRIPAWIGLHFLAARKEDQCVAFRLHL